MQALSLANATKTGNLPQRPPPPVLPLHRLLDSREEEINNLLSKHEVVLYKDPSVDKRFQPRYVE